MNDQSEFWKGEFGNDYIDRQKDMVKSNEVFFARALRHARGVKRVLEYGAGTGMNMIALSNLFPDIEGMGVEVNEKAAMEIPCGYIFRQDIFDFVPPAEMIPDLVYTKGLAIHIHPDDLPRLYRKLYDSTSRYILLCEYYSPKSTAIEYRGHTDKLWKADFAGDMLNAHPDLELIDYGFTYHRDQFPQDDISWFLMEKT